MVCRLIFLLVAAEALLSCHKQDFLDKKPATTLVVPSTFSDFQALLDNTYIMGLVPTLGEASADNYFFPYAYWMGLDTRQYNAYIWAKDIFDGQGEQMDWNLPYSQVFYANVILDGLAKMNVTAANSAQWNAMEGAALFTRGFAFYNLAQVFAPVYDSATAAGDMGIPLRLSPDITTPTVRSSVQATYDQLLSDLQQAAVLMPADFQYTNRNRPCRQAALALLARAYLSIRDYTSAGKYADSALQEYSTLIDYNTTDTTVGSPFGVLNNETIYQASFINSSSGYSTALAGLFYPNTRVDTVLFRSYASDDLRRVIYYRVKPDDSSYFKGSYTGVNYPFGGLATDELYLIRAESAARAGQLGAAQNDINTLLKNRWRTGTFSGYTFTSVEQARDTILAERRKELVFRGLRWTDLRRLNKEGANITLTRNLNGVIYTLAPGSNHYTLPIPPDVLTLADIPNNVRD